MLQGWWEDMPVDQSVLRVCLRCPISLRLESVDLLPLSLGCNV